MRNNISLNPITRHIYFQSFSGANAPILDSDYNIFYPTSGSLFWFWTNSVGGSKTFTEWQVLSHAGCTFDPHSWAGNPLFVDAANGNFHLLSSSPAIDRGADVGIVQDRDGTLVPQGVGPDIGPYECIKPIYASINGPTEIPEVNRLKKSQELVQSRSGKEFNRGIR